MKLVLRFIYFECYQLLVAHCLRIFIAKSIPFLSNDSASLFIMLEHYFTRTIIRKYIFNCLCLLKCMVKVQFMGSKLYKKNGAIFQEESYLPRIFRSSSLNLHTFRHITIVFQWQISFRKHGKSTPNDWQDHHMFWSSTLWSWRHNAVAR